MSEKKKRMPLHIKIMLGMVLGILFGVAMMQVGTAEQSVVDKAAANTIVLKGIKNQKEIAETRIVALDEFFAKGTGAKSDLVEKASLQQTILKLDAQLKSLKPETRIPDSTGKSFVIAWIKPWGKIFVNLLKLIAIPLIVASLLKGISDLKDISKFKKIGGRSILIYVGTTIIAITIGLVIVNLVQPGAGVSDETIAKMSETYAGNSSIESKFSTAASQSASGPLDFLVDMVPSNLFGALADNGSMLQVIFFIIFFGIAMLLVPEDRSKPIKDFFDGLNDIVLKMVDLIMLGAPFAVFALMATVIVSSESWEIIRALLWYSGSVILGLLLMIVFYSVLVAVFTKKNPFWFLKQLAPAQLLAFTTSSSAATLPVTMERVEEHIGVDKEVSSFVLPVGATINMDGTSLYQAVAAVFIAQALGVHLGFGDQITIVITALMASIGSAAVPGAGMVMLIIVLQSVNKFTPEQIEVGLTLIFAVDRILDMCRTTVNVTGDATVSMLVAKSVGKLGEPTVFGDDDVLDQL